MTLLLVARVLLVALVTAVACALPVLARPALPFGVRVPPAREDDPVVAGQRRVYARVVLALGVLAAVGAVLAPSRHEWWTAAVPLALLAADSVAYGTAHARIRAAKERGNWYEGTRQGVTADTSLRTDPVRLPWWWLAPAAAVTVATAVVGAVRYGDLESTFTTAFAPVFAQAAVVLLVPLTAAVVTRARPELDAARPASSARRYRVYLHGTVAALAATAACVTVTLLLLALRDWELWTSSRWTATLAYAPLAVAALIWLTLEAKVGQAGHRLPTVPDEDPTSPLVQRDDDRHWHIGGFVYANRTDPSIFVHQRAGGASWTMNLGHWAAWVVVGAVGVVVVVALAFGGGWR
ncbi:DUF1648 domain-containing protein [Streptomyces sp. NPDC058001]|uniref:DUF1648 domain-containing protein n=1 Tax=Streptomyces sp. NPDC058001 TaxID=3346300 RepID=UPI0036E7D9D6